MKKFIICLLFSLYGVKSEAVIKYSPWLNKIFSQEQEFKPTLALSNLLLATGIEHESTLYDIVSRTQKAWLRGNVERDIMQGLFEDVNLMPYFQKLDLCKSIFPKKQEYTYLILFGSKTKSVIEKLKYMEELLSKKSIKVQRLIVLTGRRILDVAEISLLKENYQIDADGLFETNMIELLLNKTTIAPTVDLLPLTLVDTPADLTDTRPRTNGTVKDWIAQKPVAGSCLAISANPYIPYQDASLRTYLPEDFQVETVGFLDERSLNDKNKNALFLDSIARWLYQEYDRQKGLKH